jgi:TolB protein
MRKPKQPKRLLLTFLGPLVLILGGCSLLEVLFPPEGPLPVEPPQGKIAFYRTPSGERFIPPPQPSPPIDLEPYTFEIYVMDVEGGNLQRLTSCKRFGPCVGHFPEEDSTNPAWSPDGRKIAFEHGGGIWVMNADGSDPHPIPLPVARASHPTWAPDGLRLAFSAGGIGVVNLDGSGFRMLTAEGTEPDWSPDGEKILFLREVRDPRNQVIAEEIWVMDANGSNLQRILSAPRVFSAVWSPDGRIVFTKGVPSERPFAFETSIWIIEANGENARKLADRGVFESLSPDGQWVIYSGISKSSTSQPDLWIMRIDGRHLRNITNTPRVSEYGPDWSPAPSKP